METVEQLVAERRGYKYLSSEGISPYWRHRYDLHNREILEFGLDEDPERDCGPGCNLATLRWIAEHCLRRGGIIVEFSIPPDANIVVPPGSEEKFRANRVRIEHVYQIGEKFPELIAFLSRLRKCQDVDFMQADTMPDETEIRSALAVWEDQTAGRLLWQAETTVLDAIQAQFGDTAKAIVMRMLEDDAYFVEKVEYPGGDIGGRWMRPKYLARLQARIAALYTLKLLLDIAYDHPIFGLAKLGIVAVRARILAEINALGRGVIIDTIEIFGKQGKFLGALEGGHAHA